METDAQAGRVLEDYANAAAGRSGLPEPQRTDARLELLSHLYEVAAAKATEAGAAFVDVPHAQAAIVQLGATEQIDAAFFAPRRARQERARFSQRGLAYVIDFVLVYAVFSILAAPFWFLNNWGQGWGPMDWTLWGGMHELLHFASVVLVLAAFEATMGQTPGKMLLKLRVVGTDGGPVDWRKAILRNLGKGHPLLALLDAGIGYLSDQKARERISDRLVHTAVVEVRQ